MSPIQHPGMPGTVFLAVVLFLSSVTVPVALLPEARAASTWVTTSEIDFNGNRCLFQDCMLKGSGAGAHIELNISDTGVWNLMNVTEAPPPRSWHSMAAIGGSDKILLFGGLPQGGPGQGGLDDTWVYDLSDNKWTKMSPATKPPARWAHQMATIWNDDKVVLFGGTGTGGVLGDTWVYDLGDNQWYTKAPTLSPSPRYGHAMASVRSDSTVVLFGGRNDTYLPGMSDTWTYDIISDQWKQLSLTGSPVQRWGHTLAAVWSDDKLLMYGGCTDMNYPKDTWVFDLSDNTWTQQNPMACPSACDRMAAATLFYDDKVMLFGGLTFSPVTVYDETWIYDIGDCQWSQKNIPDHPPAREYLAMAAVNDTRKVVIFGGINSSTGVSYNDTWTYDALIYVSMGAYCSPCFDFGEESTRISIDWSASTPSGTSVGLQIRGAETQDELVLKSFNGPDGTSNTFYSKASEVDNVPPGVRWFQYRAVLQTQNRSLTPVLNDVTVRYNKFPAAPVLTGPTYNGWTRLRRPAFNWSFLDNDSPSQGGFEWQLDAKGDFSPQDYSSGEVQSNALTFTPTSPIADGIWHWRVRTRDSEGDWGPFSGALTLKLDATPPGEFVPQAAPAGWTATDSEISFFASDNTSGMDHYELSVDGGAFETRESPCVLSGLPDGPHYIEVRAFDKAGNHADGNVTVLMDAMAPRPFTPIAAPGCWTSGPVQVSFSTSDSTSGIGQYMVKLDQGEFTAQASPFVLPALDEGEHVVTVRALDLAGNIRDEKVSVFIDRTVPDSLVLMTAPAGWTGEDPTVSFRATEKVSRIDRYESSVDGGAFEVRAGAFKVAGLSDGVHNITVRAYDMAGNRIDGQTWAYIDRTPPLAFKPVASPDGWSRKLPSVSFSATDGICATLSYRISVDGGPFVEAASPWTPQTLSDGRHNITVRAFDAAGNFRQANVTAYLDRATPFDVSLTVNGGARSSSKRQVVLGISAADNASGPDQMCFSNDGRNYTEWETFQTVKNWTISSGTGAKKVYVRVRDIAGNEARPILAEVDYQPPGRIFVDFAQGAVLASILVAVVLIAGFIVYRSRTGKKRGP